MPFVNWALKNFASPSKSDVIGVILTPTRCSNTLQAVCYISIRELAKQISQVSQKLLSELKKFSVMLLTGGTNSEIDLKKIEEHGCNFIIATPGKFHEILEKKSDHINLKPLHFLILGTLQLSAHSITPAKMRPIVSLTRSTIWILPISLNGESRTHSKVTYYSI